MITKLNGIPHRAEGSLTLRRYSVDGLCSLGAPTTLINDLHPRLQERVGLEVKALTMAMIAPRISAMAGPVRAVIDMPGHEGQLVQLLAEAGLDETITTLTIRTMFEPYFKGGSKAATVIEAMQGLDFRLDHIDDNEPDWPVLTFVSNPAARRIRALSSELAQSGEAAGKMKTDLETATAALAALNETLRDRDAALLEARQELDAANVAKATAETELAESLYRLSQAREEIRRTEGQVELIKDLLLRNAGL